MLHFLKEDDRPLLSDAIYFLTCSRRLYKFRNLVWQTQLNNLAKEKNLDKMTNYMNEVKWLTDNEKIEKLKKLL